jgi:hypothetical protein
MRCSLDTGDSHTASSSSACPNARRAQYHSRRAQHHACHKCLRQGCASSGSVNLSLCQTAVLFLLPLWRWVGTRTAHSRSRQTKTANSLPSNSPPVNDSASECKIECRAKSILLFAHCKADRSPWSVEELLKHSIMVKSNSPEEDLKANNVIGATTIALYSFTMIEPLHGAHTWEGLSQPPSAQCNSPAKCVSPAPTSAKAVPP